MLQDVPPPVAEYHSIALGSDITDFRRIAGRSATCENRLYRPSDRSRPSDDRIIECRRVRDAPFAPQNDILSTTYSFVATAEGHKLYGISLFVPEHRVNELSDALTEKFQTTYRDEVVTNPPTASVFWSQTERKWTVGVATVVISFQRRGSISHLPANLEFTHPQLQNIAMGFINANYRDRNPPPVL